MERTTRSGGLRRPALTLAAAKLRVTTPCASVLVRSAAAVVCRSAAAVVPTAGRLARSFVRGRVAVVRTWPCRLGV